MSTRTHTRDGISTEDGGVTAWRYEQLRAHGFGTALAMRIACDCRYDLHALIGLVERGCRPELAAEILAPLDERTRPC
jgi:hypothetical protein